ncbi:MAG TPA: glycoside hydrolase family 3 C-terminal domain-containing protein [Candidatus Stackebrandtia faecavium]|nr:glycoside hydrolase family 3 C-terminal domain-containing protein [Candidatus Stackebrandtia faecavium]
MNPDRSSDVESAIEAALARLDLDSKCRLLAGQDNWSLPGMPQIGLESIVMSDGPTGVRGRQWSGDPAVALPSPTAQAASWDPALAERTGRLLAAEATRKGAHVLLTPTVNLHRSPLAGRHFEYLSEDPVLSGVMATAMIRGLQSEGVAATVKHFVANDAETERMTVDNIVDASTLRQLYLLPFEMAIDGGAWSVMPAYNRVNGVSMTENARLLDDVLRREWGFDGATVSDWYAARDTVRAVLGGTDVAMPGPDTVYGDRLADAVADGRVTEADVDARVRNVLRLAARVGAWNTPVARRAAEVSIDGTGHAREVATRSFVLAKNDSHALPLDRDGSLAVIGIAASQPRVMGGGSSQVFPQHVVSPLEGLRAALGDGADIRYTPAIDPRTKLPPIREGGDLRLRAYDRDGNVLLRSSMDEGLVLWLDEFPDGLDVDMLDRIEIVGTFTPHTSGVHQFCVAGIGDFELSVEDVPVVAASLRPQGDDVVASFVDPAEERADVELTAGSPVSVRLQCTITDVSDGGPALVTARIGHAPPMPPADSGIDEAAALAGDADAAVVFVSTTESVESEGFDRTDLRLPGEQDALVSAVAAANPRTIVVVVAGAPVETHAWVDDVEAVLLTWFGGQEFGHALADVVTGAAEPGGRLPTTWPRRLMDAPVTDVVPRDGRLEYREGTSIGYRAWTDASGVAWWFGHGLGYTTWEYLGAGFVRAPSRDSFGPGDEFGAVDVSVRNVGTRTGREVVQAYVGPANGPAASRRLAGFATAEAAAGETVTVRVPILARSLQEWDTDSDSWTTPREDAIIHIGRCVSDIRTQVIPGSEA